MTGHTNHTEFSAHDTARLEREIAFRLAQSDYDIAAAEVITAANEHAQAKLKLELKKSQFEMAKAKLVRLIDQRAGEALKAAPACATCGRIFNDDEPHINCGDIK